MARIACNLARLGNFDEAKRIIAELRNIYGDGHSGRVTVWIMLAEGLILHYSEFNPASLDRIARAQLLGTAMKYTAFMAISAAWKAYIQFESSNYDDMAQSLYLARKHADLDDHDTHARYSMVLCSSFTICGEKEQAQKWFMRGRDHALKNGDQASLEALVFNRAVFNFAFLRISNCMGNLDVSELSLNRMQVESARNFQELIRTGAMTDHIHLCDARLLILQERYLEAIDKLTEVRDRKSFADYNFSPDIIDLEIAYCFLRMNDFESAYRLYSTIASLDFEGLDLDEKLVAAWLVWKMGDTNEIFGNADKLKSHFDALENKYKQMISNLTKMLSPFADTGD